MTRVRADRAIHPEHGPNGQGRGDQTKCDGRKDRAKKG